MYAAMSPYVEKKGGIFLYNNRERESNSLADDVNIQKKLWNVTSQLVGLKDSADASMSNLQINYSSVQSVI